MGPTDFLFGLPINLIVNAGQNKFEVDILKNVAKIANSIIFSSDFDFLYFKLLVFTRRIEWCPNQSAISFG